MSGNEDKPIVLEMADNMVKIRTGFDELKAMGLTEDMIVTLIQEKSKVSKTNIRKVLEGIKELQTELNMNRKQLQG